MRYRAGMTFQNPTVGRVVHVYLQGEAVVRVALVAFVHNATCINVGGFDRNGTPFSATSVGYCEEPSATSRWCWPPRE